MARIRTLKPDAWQDERLGLVSRDARLLWTVLITQADDDGRFRATPSIVHGTGYPYDPEALALLPAWLDELAEARLIVLYGAPVAGRPPYGAFRRWADHQRISKPTASKLPAPPENPRETQGDPGIPSPHARAPEVEVDREEEEEAAPPPPASAPAHEPPPAPAPQAVVTCQVEVRDMLLAAGFHLGEIQNADHAIRLTLNQLELPDDVDWPAFGKLIVRYRDDGKLKRHGPCPALRFVAKSADGPPRLSDPKRTGGRSPVGHYAAMFDGAEA